MNLVVVWLWWSNSNDEVGQLCEEVGMKLRGRDHMTKRLRNYKKIIIIELKKHHPSIKGR